LWRNCVPVQQPPNQPPVPPTHTTVTAAVVSGSGCYLRSPQRTALRAPAISKVWPGMRNGTGEATGATHHASTEPPPPPTPQTKKQKKRTYNTRVALISAATVPIPAFRGRGRMLAGRVVSPVADREEIPGRRCRHRSGCEHRNEPYRGWENGLPDSEAHLINRGLNTCFDSPPVRVWNRPLLGEELGGRLRAITEVKGRV